MEDRSMSWDSTRTLGWSLLGRLERFLALRVMRPLGLWELSVWTVENDDGTRQVFFRRASADRAAESRFDQRAGTVRPLVRPEPLSFWLRGAHREVPDWYWSDV